MTRRSFLAISCLAAAIAFGLGSASAASRIPDIPAPQSMIAEKGSTAIGVANNTIGNIVMLSTSASALEVAPMPGAAAIVVDLNSFSRDTIGGALFGAGQDLVFDRPTMTKERGVIRRSSVADVVGSNILVNPIGAITASAATFGATTA